MSKANDRDETRDSQGVVVYYFQWPSTRDGQIDENGTLRAMSSSELAVWDSEEAADTAAAESDTRRTSLTGAVVTLRQWADDANATTVTSGNAVATLQVVVDRLGVFFDRFADLIVEQYGQG